VCLAIASLSTEFIICCLSVPSFIFHQTSNELQKKLRELTSPTIKEAAVTLADKMNAEDGVMNALEHFWNALPVDSMMCSISLIMGKSILAKYRFSSNDWWKWLLGTTTHIPISAEVASVLMDESRGSTPISNIPIEKDVRSMVGDVVGQVKAEKVQPFGTTTYALRHRGGYDSFSHGIHSSIMEFIGWLFGTCYQIYHFPDKSARRHGCCGCMCGAILLPLAVAYYACRMLIVFIDRLGVTIANNVFGQRW